MILKFFDAWQFIRASFNSQAMEKYIIIEHKAHVLFDRLYSRDCLQHTGCCLELTSVVYNFHPSLKFTLYCFVDLPVICLMKREDEELQAYIHGQVQAFRVLFTPVFGHITCHKDTMLPVVYCLVKLHQQPNGHD